MVYIYTYNIPTSDLSMVVHTALEKQYSLNIAIMRYVNILYLLSMLINMYIYNVTHVHTDMYLNVCTFTLL